MSIPFQENSKDKSTNAEKPIDSNIETEKKTSNSSSGKMEDDEAKKIVESIFYVPLPLACGNILWPSIVRFVPFL